MGFRFRKSKSLFPGVRLNIIPRGISTTIGGKIARTTIGRKGIRGSASVPGTGLSYSTGALGKGTGSTIKGFLYFVVALLFVGYLIFS